MCTGHLYKLKTIAVPNAMFVHILPKKSGCPLIRMIYSLPKVLSFEKFHCRQFLGCTKVTTFGGGHHDVMFVKTWLAL